MIAATTFQNAYNNLYLQMYNYIWEFRIVEKLADLEISVYRVFPDIEDVKHKYNELKRAVSCTDAWKEDEFKMAFHGFETALTEDKVTDADLYSKLVSFKGVISGENDN